MKVTYNINLPLLHQKQAEIKRSPAKRKVVNAGRRAGKTTLAAHVAVDGAGQGKRVLYATPKQEQAGAFWDKAIGWLAEPIAAKHIYKNESRHILQFPGGGRIRAKTAWDEDGLRGDYADLLILDEYALMSPDAWDLVGAPMLLDNDGDAWFISTPRRKNHFFHAHCRGIADGKRWVSWHFTSHDNPHLSKAALAEITSDLTDDGYKQEILAEFLENEGAVFRNIGACLGALESTREEHEGHYIVAGIDWGKHNDFTVISIGCATCEREVALDRFNQIDYIFQRWRLHALFEKWKPGWILAEANSMGEPIIEQLQYGEILEDGTRFLGLPLEGFQTTVSSKPVLIENLALTLERTEWQFLPDPIAKAELEAYERTVSLKTGRSSYGAPEGLHDDTVIARALMRRAAGDGGPAIIEIG